MATFVLIHGGGHTGSHWSSFRPHLDELGHQTLAPDVPMDEPDAGAARWAEVIVSEMPDADPSEIVLVGHSLAGLAIPIVAAHIPVQRLVFLCANLPVPGVSYETYLANNPDAMTIPPLSFDDRGRVRFAWEVAREFFYTDCDESVARAAYDKLVPSAALLANREPCPLKAWPEVPATYILCQEDRIIGPAWSRRASVAQLGVEAIELPGGHSPFLSRPGPLATLLDGLAT